MRDLSFSGSVHIFPAPVKSLNGLTPKKTWFPGLNGLRFFAAFLVVIMHIHNNMGVSGLPQLPAWPILFKGLTAVSFFFELSGFLITYLLLKEYKQSHTIQIKSFYLRRVFRIWPLYFIVVLSGLLFYWKIVPALHLPFENNYNLGAAVLLYLFFLANLMNSYFHVGGMLHITWSIAVEEQFYLFWAPLVKRFHKRIPLLIGTVTILSLILHSLNTLNVFHYSKEMQAFIGTLQFHYMGFGAAFAWALVNGKKRLLENSFFTNRILQAVVVMLLAAYLLFYMKTKTGDLISPIPLALIFGWLIITVSTSGRTWISFENRVLNYLGKISYGIYMFHMPVVYAVSFIFRRYGYLSAGFFYFPLFYTAVFAIAVGIASFSYFYIEKPILKLNTAPLKIQN
jgi:peptidoglycan/LPS O-acetylase OafA/YrhL